MTINMTWFYFWNTEENKVNMGVDFLTKHSLDSDSRTFLSLLAISRAAHTAHDCHLVTTETTI